MTVEERIAHLFLELGTGLDTAATANPERKRNCGLDGMTWDLLAEGDCSDFETVARAIHGLGLEVIISPDLNVYVRMPAKLTFR